MIENNTPLMLKQLGDVIKALRDWGINHRKKITGK